MPDFGATITGELFSLTEVKTHLRVDFSDDDTYISTLITAATKWCEEKQKKFYITKTKTEYLDKFPKERYIELTRAPLQSVTHLKYTDKDGAVTTWGSGNYIVDKTSFVPKIVLGYNISWPTVQLSPVNAIEIAYVAGYGAAVDVPQMIKHAILLLVSHWYENREAVSTLKFAEVPMAAKSLLDLSGGRVNV
ncbi:MAG: head-tail connector protein [Carboxydocellales bacterium]